MPERETSRTGGDAVTRVMDLTFLLNGRVHLTGFDCQAIRTLRQVKATFGPPWGPNIRFEFTDVSNTNPAKVRCVDCWSENPRVRAANPTRVVIRWSDALPRP